MIKHITILSTAALLALSACSSSGDSNGGDASIEVKPIEPILDSEIEIVTDPSGTSATFSVDTNIPVACAVIYGTSDAFGLLAVDNDMQGGAHEDHGPLLTGLVPDTEYQYVLQGSDAAGSIYRSAVMTFRTPPAADNALGDNLALDASVTGASSSFSDSFAPEMAIDGDLATEWSSAGDGDDAWIEISLPEPAEITAIAFKTREMTDGTAITETFTVRGGPRAGYFGRAGHWRDTPVRSTADDRWQHRRSRDRGLRHRLTRWCSCGAPGGSQVLRL